MIHIIYIYFIIISFMFGLIIDSTFTKISDKVITLLFGTFMLIYGYLIKPTILFIDKHTEISTLYLLFFTDFFKNKVTNKNLNYFKTHYQKIKHNRYKRWLMKQIDKKYGFGITEY